MRETLGYDTGIHRKDGLKPGSLDLSDPDAFRYGFPHDYFRLLRLEEPVCWNESRTPNPDTGRPDAGYYSVTKHSDVIHVSRRTDLFSSERGGVQMRDAIPDSLENVRSMLLSMDPPEHVRYRRLVQAGFTPRMVRQLRPRIRAAAKYVVDRIAHQGSAEFVADVAMHLPLILICELMGIPQEDRQRVFDWSNRLVAFDDPDYRDPDATQTDVAQQMWLYAHQLAERKRAHPDETLISQYANGEVDGERISELQLNNFFVLLAIAGNETTRNATSHAIRLLHEHPDQLDRLRSDVTRYLPGLVEEVLRFASPVMYFRRTAIRDTELRGVRIRAGDKVLMWYPSANRDEDVWNDADRFDITRDPNPHLAFGIGEHFCLGANLARMQLECILEEVLDRLPDIALAGPPKLLRSNLVAGIKAMPVQFSPEKASA